MHVVAILLIILGVAFVITMGSAMVADLFEGRRKARQKKPRSPQRNPIKKSQTNTVTPTSHLWKAPGTSNGAMKLQQRSASQRRHRSSRFTRHRLSKSLHKKIRFINASLFVVNAPLIFFIETHHPVSSFEHRDSLQPQKSTTPTHNNHIYTGYTNILCTHHLREIQRLLKHNREENCTEKHFIYRHLVL